MMDLYQQVWAADNRNSSEVYAEAIIASLFGHKRSTDRSYDQSCASNRRHEIKAARIVIPLRKMKNKTIKQRAVSFADLRSGNFEGSIQGRIQHLKHGSFDRLHYLALFSDCIVVFGMSAADILANAKDISYCRTQTRGSIPDQDGQFSFSKSNMTFHLEYCFGSIMTYDVAAHMIPKDLL